ncbi:hypothetical protein ScPMuIL_005924 [Solemya velum]
MADDYNDDEWSKEVYSLNNLVDQLPCLVRVCEGIYGDNDIDTFSNGDILWLEEKRTIQKISAHEVEDPSQATWSVDPEDLLIPLGLKCPVKVERPDNAIKTTNLISNLMNNPPRHVRVDESFLSPSGVHFPQGSQFEILRILPGKGHKAISSLVVLYQKKEISLPANVAGRFTPLLDNMVYSLKDMIQKYTLPQYVKLLGDDIQRLATPDIEESIGNIKPFRKHGIFRLLNQISQTVIIGHVKPISYSDIEMSKSQFCKRSCVILPLQSNKLSEIEFQVIHYSEPAIYERILTRNFSHTAKPGEELFEGLYIEYKKKPRVYIKEADCSQAGDVPPPIPLPPRTYRHAQYDSHKTKSSPKPVRPPPPHNLETRANIDKNSPEDEYVIPEWKPTASRTSRKQKMPCRISPPPSAIPQTAISIGSQMGDFSLADVFSGTQYNTEEHLVLDDESKKETKTHRFKGIFKGKHKKTLPNVVTVKGMPNPDNSALPNTHDYDYPDFSTMEFSLPTSSGYSSQSTPESRPIGLVKPKVQTSCMETPLSEKLEECTVQDLCSILETCGLGCIVNTCQKEKIDGKLICSLQDEVFAKPPFNLGNLQIVKLHHMISGWRPKTS